MEAIDGSTDNQIIDVRYNKRHWISMFIAASFFIVLIILAGWHDLFWVFYSIIFAAALSGQGFYAIKGGKSIRLDKKNKVLHKYTLYGLTSFKYRYDRLFFKGKKLFREIDGKVKFIEIRSIDNRKDDIEVLYSEILKG